MSVSSGSKISPALTSRPASRTCVTPSGESSLCTGACGPASRHRAIGPFRACGTRPRVTRGYPRYQWKSLPAHAWRRWGLTRIRSCRSSVWRAFCGCWTGWQRRRRRHGQVEEVTCGGTAGRDPTGYCCGGGLGRPWGSPPRRRRPRSEMHRHYPRPLWRNAGRSRAVRRAVALDWSRDLLRDAPCRCDKHLLLRIACGGDHKKACGRNKNRTSTSLHTPWASRQRLGF